MLKNVLRQLSQDAIIAANTLAENRVYTPRTYKLWRGLYPCVEIKTPAQTRVSLGKNGVPHFNTVVTVAIIATVQCDTEDEAEEALEVLENQIEQAIFTNFNILKEIEQFETTQSQQIVNSEGEQFIGQVQINFNMQSYEEFDPASQEVYSLLNTVAINVDTVYPYDATGTYEDPPHPETVQAAPRTRGRDGRNEGYLEIDVSE